MTKPIPAAVVAVVEAFAALPPAERVQALSLVVARTRAPRRAWPRAERRPVPQSGWLGRVE